MFLSTLFEPVLFGLGAFLSAYAMFATVFRRKPASAVALDTTDDISGDTLVYLVRDGGVADTNFSGGRFLDRFPYAETGLPRLRAALNSRFDGIDALFARGPRPDVHTTSRDGNLRIVSESLDDALRLRITPSEGSTGSLEDIHRHAATEAELETLRESTDKTPFLVWREAPDGTPVWVNRAYADQVAHVFTKDRLLNWPLPRLFPDIRRGEARRLSLIGASGSGIRWFECHGTPIGPDTLYTAFDATATVQAETKLRDFTQTLSKTFAELDIGLAIFDRSRHLALFNPALMDLTGLPIDFLTAKPSLIAMIDKLRERKMLPEPRDYKSWRQSIAELEIAAQSGTYSETWALPGHRTYRVSGRPHPDGAIAFLFEDISEEMSLTRSFRADLETGQAVLDNLDQAIAVFAPDGAVAMTNHAYRTLWDSAPDTFVIPRNVSEETRCWLAKTLPTPIWGDFRDFIEHPEDRAEWMANTTMKDGRILNCRFIPLADGGTQVVFDTATTATSGKEELRRVV